MMPYVGAAKGAWARPPAYAGKFVGLANGQVAIVADSLEDVAQHLRRREPDPQRTFCIEAGLDYAAVQNICEAA